MATVSVGALDRQLASASDAVERMGSVLIDLEDDPARVLLPVAPLRGHTAAAWSQVEPLVAVLWQLYPIARDALSAITAARGTRVSIDATARSRLMDELTEPTVAVDAAACEAVRRVAGEHPDLSSLSGFASPRSLDQLSATFDLLHACVVAVLGQVGTVWDEVLPRLTELDRDLMEIETTAAVSGHPSNEAAVARRMLDEARAGAREDPLDLDVSRVDEIAAAVDRSRTAVTDREARHARQLADRAGVVGRVDELSVELAEVIRLRATATAKIQLEPPLSDLRDEQEELERLLTQIDAAGAGTLTDEQADRVIATCARVEMRIRSVRAEAVARIARRDELRGRLDGFRAKAVGIGRAEDIDLDAPYQAARAQLYVAPCDLAAAGEAVKTYQLAVNRSRATEDQP